MTEIVSFICAILCGLGLGGGNLLVVYLTRIAGFDQQSAQGLGLIFFVSSTAVCLVIHAVKKRINKSTQSRENKKNTKQRKCRQRQSVAVHVSVFLYHSHLPHSVFNTGSFEFQNSKRDVKKNTTPA